MVRIRLADEHPGLSARRDQRLYLIADTAQWIAVTSEDPTARLPFAPREAVRFKADAIIAITSTGP
jgi:hypothetical protein